MNDKTVKIAVRMDVTAYQMDKKLSVFFMDDK